MEKINELLKEIKTNLSQTSSSQKDEVRVMKAMLNDKDYKVDIYGKDGKEGTYCPAEDAREMIASVISAAAKIPQAEAAKLADDYEFKKSEATSMINLSKEFVNTYLQTGRKPPLGGRAKSDVALSLKEVEEGVRTYPKKVGVDANGKPIYQKAEAKISAHESIRVSASCPTWIE